MSLTALDWPERCDQMIWRSCRGDDEDGSQHGVWATSPHFVSAGMSARGFAYVPSESLSVSAPCMHGRVLRVPVLLIEAAEDFSTACIWSRRAWNGFNRGPRTLEDTMWAAAPLSCSTLSGLTFA